MDYAYDFMYGSKRTPIEAPKYPGRNEKCYCGSNKKYKHCHWKTDDMSKFPSEDADMIDSENIETTDTDE